MKADDGGQGADNGAIAGARRALILGVAAAPLWLASLAWVPFAVTDTPVPSGVGQLLPVAELAGLTAGVAAIVTGRRARREAGDDAVAAAAALGARIGTGVVIVGIALNVVGLALR